MTIESMIWGSLRQVNIALKLLEVRADALRRPRLILSEISDDLPIRIGGQSHVHGICCGRATDSGTTRVVDTQAVD